ncbi:MAG: DUF4835 family protein [Flavobacteriaceae bacterium]|nr:DUF4835 family protein [Flavobacteriaceae bacterium]
MRNFLIICFCILISWKSYSQELNASIVVNSDKISQTNQQVFNTLERALNEFVNKTKWTNKIYKLQEKVNCNMQINIQEFEGDRFGATIQVQSTRPVYGTSYETPVFNYNDKQFRFEYTEFEPLIYNENNIDSNLVAVISYYVYIVLGMDGDTFSLEGGSPYFEKAQAIASMAQGTNYSGWKRNDGNRNRFILIDNLMSNAFREYRILMYNYHRKGLDIMASKAVTAKQTIAGSMRLLDPLVKRRPNAFLIQTFFDAKTTEIVNLFSDGPKVDVKRLLEVLMRVAPIYSNEWKEIKY